MKRRDNERGLELVGNILLGEHERPAWNPHNAFIRTAASGRRQEASRFCNVRADDGEVAVFEFKDVRAALAAGRLRAVGVRVGAESFCEHAVTSNYREMQCQAWTL